MSQLSRITFNPKQCGGKPCIRGMRIRVKDVLDMLAGGATEVQIFPALSARTFWRRSNTRRSRMNHPVLMVGQR